MNEFSFTVGVARLNPMVDLLDPVEYTVVLGASAVKDSGESTYAEITGTNYQVEWLDQTPPTTSAYRPSGATKVVTMSGNLAFSFSETV